MNKYTMKNMLYRFRISKFVGFQDESLVIVQWLLAASTPSDHITNGAIGKWFLPA